MDKDQAGGGSLSIFWEESRPSGSLDEETVQMFRLRTQKSEADLASLNRFLTTSELESAAGFRFYKDRSTFISTRAALRMLLSSFIGVGPEKLVLDYGHKGKPFLPAYPNIKFNVSHSGEFALICITKDFEVGVDIEFIHRKVEYSTLANQFFSQAEAEKLMKLEGRDKKLGFFNCWTRKEAFIKARGDGLSFPLDQFEVSLIPGVEACLLDTYWDKNEKFNWSLYSFQPAKDYVGAVAIEGKIEGLRFFQFNP